MSRDNSMPLAVAAFAGDEEDLRNALLLAESLREFGGTMAGAPVWIYTPPGLETPPGELARRAAGVRAGLRTSPAPLEAERYPLARKVFAAARAESDAAAVPAAGVLAWMDPDTVVLREPRAFLLPPGVRLGYRPVMHRRIGSPFDEPPDEYWSRVYEVLSVPESAVFPVVAPADGAKLRAYFNAGLLVVRPEHGILRGWAAAFPRVTGDPTMATLCHESRERALFVHQAALAGSILASVPRGAMVELPGTYNFPLFFQEQYGALRAFDSLEDVVTLRYDVYFRSPAPGWGARLKGPERAVAWLRDRFGAG